MTNVYEGATDARQSDRVDEPVSRFRPRYRALTDDEKALHDEIKGKASELEALFERVKAGRYRSLALTPAEEWRAEREKIAEKRPHLALVGHTPAPAPKPVRDPYSWQSLAELLPIGGE